VHSFFHYYWKEKKKKEEAKAKRNEERKKKKNEEKQKKAEMKKKKQQENAVTKTSKGAKQPSTSIPPLNPHSDSESLHESDNEDGIQSHEILNDECMCYLL